jgi:hypothetical protein
LSQPTAMETDENVENLFILIKEWISKRQQNWGWIKNVFKFVHEDNTLACNTVLLVRQSLLQKEILLMECPLHFFSWAPCDVFLYPTTKTWLKRTFCVFEGGPAAYVTCLKVYWKMFSRNASKCGRKGVAKGNYFEGGNSS